jgi:hypothetical protein
MTSTTTTSDQEKDRIKTNLDTLFEIQTLKTQAKIDEEGDLTTSCSVNEKKGKKPGESVTYIAFINVYEKIPKPMATTFRIASFPIPMYTSDDIFIARLLKPHNDPDPFPDSLISVEKTLKENWMPIFDIFHKLMLEGWEFNTEIIAIPAEDCVDYKMNVTGTRNNVFYSTRNLVITSHHKRDNAVQFTVEETNKRSIKTENFNESQTSDLHTNIINKFNTRLSFGAQYEVHLKRITVLLKHENQ